MDITSDNSIETEILLRGLCNALPDIELGDMNRVNFGNIGLETIFANVKEMKDFAHSSISRDQEKVAELQKRITQDLNSHDYPAFALSTSGVIPNMATPEEILSGEYNKNRGCSANISPYIISIIDYDDLLSSEDDYYDDYYSDSDMDTTHLMIAFNLLNDTVMMKQYVEYVGGENRTLEELTADYTGSISSRELMYWINNILTDLMQDEYDVYSFIVENTMNTSRNDELFDKLVTRDNEYFWTPRLENEFNTVDSVGVYTMNNAMANFS